MCVSPSAAGSQGAVAACMMGRQQAECTASCVQVLRL
jgi:hypothetical protein